MTGSIPDLSGLTNLEFLYLDHNNLTGEIPVELGTITSLVWLRLNGNQLTGSIPTNMVNLTASQADGLDIRYNGLYTLMILR